jgi:hypothetical protein
MLTTLPVCSCKFTTAHHVIRVVTQMLVARIVLEGKLRNESLGRVKNKCPYGARSGAFCYIANAIGFLVSY